jgi:hypothetical protein
MLTIHDSSRPGRRDFLRIGTLGLGGLSLSGLPPLNAASAGPAATSNVPVTDKSVVFLFLHGGPSQVETFDPKMSAPAGVRSATGEVQTSLPGVTFGASFPKLARLAGRVSVVRSFVTGDGNHDIKPVVGRETFGANLGSVYSHVAGANHPATGMPTNAALFPRAVDPGSQTANFSFGRFDAVGPFAASAAPFMPGAGGGLQRDMELKLPRERLDDRRLLLRSFDGLKAALDGAGFDAAREKALRVILGGAGEAFDLTKESLKTVERYDTAPLVRPENINKKWRNYHNYVDNARSLGRLLLLARRLCERGCGFVTVTTSFVWDMHADVNNAPVAGAASAGPSASRRCTSAPGPPAASRLRVRPCFNASLRRGPVGSTPHDDARRLGLARRLQLLARRAPRRSAAHRGPRPGHSLRPGVDAEVVQLDLLRRHALGAPAICPAAAETACSFGFSPAAKATPKSMAFGAGLRSWTLAGLVSVWMTPFWRACRAAWRTGTDGPGRGSASAPPQCLMAGTPLTGPTAKCGVPSQSVASRALATSGWFASAGP